MKPWFRKSCDWHRTAAVDELRGMLGQQAPLALVVLDSVCAWCAENNTATIPAPSVDREVRTWTTNVPLGRRLVDALVAVGLLDLEGNVFAIDPAIVQRSEASEGEAGEAAPSSRRPRAMLSRQERYRQAHADDIKAKDRARKASRKGASSVTESVAEGVAERHAKRHGTSRNGVTESTTPVAEGIAESRRSATFRDAPSPPDPPPTPAQAQAQAQAREGAPGGPLLAPRMGAETPEAPLSETQETPEAPAPPAALEGPAASEGSEAPGGTGSSETPAALAAPVAPTSSGPARSTRPKKPAPKRPLPARAQLAAAYAAGVSQATGAPCSPPSERWELDALDAMASTHAAGRIGAELLGWLTEQGEGFAIAKAGDSFLAGKGFSPKLCLSWLNGGAEGRPLPPQAAPPPPPRISPHPRRPLPPAPPSPGGAPPVPAAQALAGALSLLGGLDGGFEAPPSRPLPPLALRPRSPAERAELIAKQRAQLLAAQSLTAQSLASPSQEPTA